MLTLRYALLILVAAQAGCAATPKVDCSKEEKRNWHAANSTMVKQIKYPAKAQRIKQEGKVIVALTINEDGSAKGSIKQSSGSPLLDAEALKIEEFKYTPPVCSGQKTSITMDVQIDFKLYE